MSPKPDNLSSIPQIYVMEGETDFKLSADGHTPTLRVHIWTYIKIKKVGFRIIAINIEC